MSQQDANIRQPDDVRESDAGTSQPDTASSLDGMRVAVVDYGAGNLLSLTRALAAVGAEPLVVATGDELRALAATAGEVDAVALPGVGAAGQAMRLLNESGLAEELRARRWPLLGVCLGMQLFYEWLDEGACAGLGLLPGVVRRLQPRAGFKIPHMGWNRVAWAGAQPLYGGQSGSGEQPAPAYYFVHSYTCLPTDANAAGIDYALAEYSEPICASVCAPGIVGVQYHPEKSGAVGLATLQRALTILRPPLRRADSQ